MLELGKAGTLGAGKGVLPLLSDGAVVATLQASNWKEQATAVIGEREWVLSKHKGELRGRWAVDPEDSARLRARQTSFWKGTHRFVSGGREVARSGSTGGWSPRPTLTAVPELPVEHQVFLLWLELVITRRNNAAVTAATTAGVVGGSS